MKKILSQQSVEEDTFIFCDNYVIVSNFALSAG